MTDLLEDREFWIRAAFSACGWLFVAPEKELRQRWIDEFTPSRMRRTNAAAEVSGTAGVMFQDASSEFEFVAIIPWSIVNRDRVHFEIADLQIDLGRKALEIVFGRQPKKPNKAPEPTPGSVTPRAFSR